MSKFDIINKHLEKKIMKQSVALINAYKGLDNNDNSHIKQNISDYVKPTPKLNNLFILDPPASIFSSSPSHQMMTMMSSTDQKSGIKQLASKAP